MTFTYRPAVRENVPLIIGMIGGTGSGKTYSALELATGLAGGKRFCGIDTEAGRMKHYADHFAFDHGDLGTPFRPDHYIEAIVAADAAGYPVVVVDSMSHVWAGDGGILDWQEEELTRMAGTDWQKREACKTAAWIKPKMSHKRMVQKFLQLRCHLIMCFRAEPKIEMVKENGKMKVVPKVSKTGKDGWIPICEKNLPFELTMSFLLTDEAPGVPNPIKLERDHRPLVALDKPIDRQLGAKLAEWAAGAEPKAPAVAAPSAPAPQQSSPSTQARDEEALGVISVDQVTVLEDRCKETGIPVARLIAAAKVSALRQIKRDDYKRALDWIERKVAEGART